MKKVLSFAAIVAFVAVVAFPAESQAIDTDNFTCTNCGKTWVPKGFQKEPSKGPCFKNKGGDHNWVPAY